MTYPHIPDHLDSAKEIMVWLKLVEAEGNAFAAELSRYASAGTLTDEIAASYLDKFIWLIAAVEKAHEAIRGSHLDPDVEAPIAASANAIHEFGESISQLLLDELKDDGANAMLLLKQAQARHHT